MRHAVRRAPRVQTAVAGDAQRRLEAAPRIVDASVNDFAVAAAGLDSKPLVPLDQHDLAAPRSQLAGAGEPDDARADDDRVSVQAPSAAQSFHGTVPVMRRRISARSRHTHRSPRTPWTWFAFQMK